MHNTQNIPAPYKGARSKAAAGIAKIRQAGFTLQETVIAIVIMAVIGGIGTYALGNLRGQAIDNSKATNAARLTQLAGTALQAGATEGAGATNNIDTTSATTAVASLNTGVTVNGVTYQMQPAVGTPSSYTFSGTPSAQSIVFGYTAGTAALP